MPFLTTQDAVLSEILPMQYYEPRDFRSSLHKGCGIGDDASFTSFGSPPAASTVNKHDLSLFALSLLYTLLHSLPRTPFFIPSSLHPLHRTYCLAIDLCLFVEHEQESWR
jgi:hypothetical protein